MVILTTCDYNLKQSNTNSKRVAPNSISIILLTCRLCNTLFKTLGKVLLNVFNYYF